MTKTFLATLALILPAAAAQDGHLLDPGVRDHLHQELSGEHAKQHVIQITRHHRIQGSRGYRDAAQYVLGQLRDYRFDEEAAWIESFESDGKKHYQTWQSPSGWDIESGELSLVEPYHERLATFRDIAMSVITYSNAGDVTAGLVSVGAGTSDADYEGKDVQGKFVLATGYGGAVHRLAVLKYGAAAVVCYLDDERARDHPDMLQYTGMWPRPDELESTTFGFNLSNRDGEKLRDMLARKEKVVLSGKVEGIGLEPYFMDVVVAEIKGSEKPDEVLVFSAHLDHPKESANDNASGSGALLDIARGLSRLIKDHKLPQPRRTLRFMWVPEWYGTMAYIDAHPELKGPPMGGTVLANMNMDMVGENLEQLHSQLIITRNPLSVPDVLDIVVRDMAQMVGNMTIRHSRGSGSAPNYKLTDYSGGSDHMMFIDRDIPGVMLSHAPDYTHHTSEDTTDKVDPEELERCELIATGVLWYLANLDDDQAEDLLHLARMEAQSGVGGQGHRALRSMKAAGASGATPDDYARLWAEGHRAIDVRARVEKQRMASILRYVPLDTATPGFRQTLQRAHAAVDLELEHQQTAIEEAARYDAGNKELRMAGLEGDPRVPRRTTRGPLAFDLPASKLSGERAAWYASPDNPLSDTERFEIVNFVGWGNVGDIRDLVSAEFGPVPLAAVARYLEDLESLGLLEWE